MQKPINTKIILFTFKDSKLSIVKFLRLLSVISILFFVTEGFCQSGSAGAFSFLKLTLPARLAASGGSPLAVFDKDINLAIYNPSLITKDIDKHLTFNFTDYFTDIHGGSAAYSGTYKKLGSLTASLQFLNYGTFKQADADGNILGEFYASDYAFQLGWGRSLHPFFSMGANVKIIYSKYESYSSSAVAVDVAASYHSKSKRTAASLIARNLGRQLKPYVEGSDEDLPGELILSLSHKLEKAPLLIHLIGTRLEKWDLTYSDPDNRKPTVDPLTGEKIPEKLFESFADNFARHLVAGASFIPSENFQITHGYNYLRRHEMKLESRTALVGFSWGVGLRIKMFHINYARAAYHLSGSTNHFTVTTSIEKFK
jgi:hypothetical protein